MRVLDEKDFGLWLRPLSQSLEGVVGRVTRMRRSGRVSLLDSLLLFRVLELRFLGVTSLVKFRLRKEVVLVDPNRLLHVKRRLLQDVCREFPPLPLQIGVGVELLNEEVDRCGQWVLIYALACCVLTWVG